MKTAAIVVAAIAALVIIVLGSTWIGCRHVEKMAELGYQEDTVPGSSMTHWRKCK